MSHGVPGSRPTSSVVRTANQPSAAGALMTQWAALPPVERIGDVARREAASRPDRLALIDADQRLTYGQLDGLVERCTAALVATGVQRGQSLAMLTTPRWEQVVVFLACARLGAIASGLLLYGMSMLYGATGTLDVNGVAQAIFNGRGNRLILIFGLVFVVSAIAFKRQSGKPPRKSEPCLKTRRLARAATFFRPPRWFRSPLPRGAPARSLG